MPTEPPSSTTRRESAAGSSPSATHWSLIRAAGDETSPRHEQAVETLARRHWFPLYIFARRLGRSPEDAADLTQGFFENFLARNTWTTADSKRGRFRSFLLVCFKNFVANERDRSRAARRGGGLPLFSIDPDAAEAHWIGEPAAGETPDLAYDRQWAREALARAMDTVRAEYAAAGKGPLHDQLRLHLWDDPVKESHRALADRLGLTEAAVKMAVLRLRRRCREALLAEVAKTVGNPNDIEEEYRDLIAALRT